MTRRPDRWGADADGTWRLTRLSDAARVERNKLRAWVERGVVDVMAVEPGEPARFSAAEARVVLAIAAIEAAAGEVFRTAALSTTAATALAGFVRGQAGAGWVVLSDGHARWFSAPRMALPVPPAGAFIVRVEGTA